MKVKEVKIGFEKEAELLLKKKEDLENEKNLAIEEAIKKVNEEFAERGEIIVSILNLITVDIETPDVEVAEEAELEPEVSAEPAELPEEEPEVQTEVEPEATQPEEVKPAGTAAVSPSLFKFN